MVVELSPENLVLMLTPVWSGLFCIVMLLLNSPIWSRLRRTGMRLTLIVYYLMIIFNWSMLVVMSFFPDTFIALCLPVTLSMIIVPLMLYRFVFILTRTNRKERFSLVHYVLPVILFLAGIVWSVYMIKTDKEQAFLDLVTPDRVILIALLLRLSSGFVYSLMSIVRYLKYTRYMLNYSSDLQQGSIYWLRIFFILWITFLLVPLLVILLSIEGLLVSVSLLLLQNIFLCFNIIRGNYVLANGKPVPKEEKPDEKQEHIRQEEFEKYIRQEKPYLNPSLTIVEVAQALHTNRSYLSAFINQTYGMNFSQLVNEHRLVELNRILEKPQNKEKSNMEKITLAGFGSYQSYRRALLLHEKHKTLKAFE